MGVNFPVRRGSINRPRLGSFVNPLQRGSVPNSLETKASFHFSSFKRQVVMPLGPEPSSSTDKIYNFDESALHAEHLKPEAECAIINSRAGTRGAAPALLQGFKGLFGDENVLELTGIHSALRHCNGGVTEV